VRRGTLYQEGRDYKVGSVVPLSRLLM